MPICIHCCLPLPSLYTTYSKADDKSLGKGVRLTQCPRCKGFADKYVEHDFVVLCIDLVLIRPEVRLTTVRDGREECSDKGNRSTGTSYSTDYEAKMTSSTLPAYRHEEPSILRLSLLLLLFDVYLTWARIEKATPTPLAPPPGLLQNTTLSTLTSPPASSSHHQPQTFLATQPILFQYAFFLLLCAVETASFHLPIRFLLSLPHPPTSTRAWTGRLYNSLLPYYPHPSLISTALLVSSFTKLFPLLLLVWNYDLPSSASAVSWAVIINNVAALEILLGSGYLRAMGLCAVGAVCRAGVGWGILRMVGVGGGIAAAGVVETGDVIEMGKRIAESVGFG
ncbi:hypothetical protein LTR95_015502 [Oleoguttula sp. CCFEE 5521]